MKEQIEEMAKITTSADPYVICKGQSCLTCEFQDIEKNCYCAKALYNAGYRKQSEGYWKPSPSGSTNVYCSLCGAMSGGGIYCSHCGAKMKGEKQ